MIITCNLQLPALGFDRGRPSTAGAFSQGKAGCRHREMDIFFVSKQTSCYSYGIDQYMMTINCVVIKGSGGLFSI